MLIAAVRLLMRSAERLTATSSSCASVAVERPSTRALTLTASAAGRRLARAPEEPAGLVGVPRAEMEPGGVLPARVTPEE